ncbi:MAG: hypothetical protein KDC87_05740 [Planctomycetes bacterium]|nr:hypothetical protein [Planctomycetota bacterium]MCB9868736.1 hypothetical protein [Planctomycetota bacterium]MCB9888748.1 hypothetical protein [Planctomycetota bacterium]
MTSPRVPGLLLWPLLVTIVLSCLRLAAEVKGMVTANSGGSGSPFGIVWLVFVFGAWFGLRLARAGSRPRIRPGWLWSMLAACGLVAAVLWAFQQVSFTDQSDAAYEVLRGAVLRVVLVAVGLTVALSFVWPRLSWTLLLYGLGARLTVVALTCLAKVQGWNTHYTKFGPAGIERGFGETMLSAGIAQLGIWVPFTVIAGGAVGSMVGALAAPRTASVGGRLS